LRIFSSYEHYNRAADRVTNKIDHPKIVALDVTHDMVRLVFKRNTINSFLRVLSITEKVRREHITLANATQNFWVIQMSKEAVDQHNRLFHLVPLKDRCMLSGAGI